MKEKEGEIVKEKATEEPGQTRYDMREPLKKVKGPMKTEGETKNRED